MQTSSAFHSKPFSKRYLHMGNLAQGVFLRWAERNNVAVDEFGFNRPPFTKFFELPRVLRYTPDYVCEVADDVFEIGTRHVMVEVKGVGRDQSVKIKIDNLNSLVEWESFTGCPLVLFVFDSHHKRISYTMRASSLAAMAKQLPVAEFHEGGGKKKPYYDISTSMFAWESLPTHEINIIDVQQHYNNLVMHCKNLVKVADSYELPPVISASVLSLRGALRGISE